MDGGSPVGASALGVTWGIVVVVVVVVEEVVVVATAICVPSGSMVVVTITGAGSVVVVGDSLGEVVVVVDVVVLVLEVEVVVEVVVVVVVGGATIVTAEDVAAVVPSNDVRVSTTRKYPLTPTTYVSEVAPSMSVKTTPSVETCHTYVEIPLPVHDEPVAITVPPYVVSPAIDGGVLLLGIVTPTVRPLPDDVVASIKFAI